VALRPQSPRDDPLEEKKERREGSTPWQCPQQAQGAELYQSPAAGIALSLLPRREEEGADQLFLRHGDQQVVDGLYFG